MQYLALLSLSLIWGASFLFIKVLLDYFTPFGIVFYRSLFGVVTIFIIMLILKKPLIPEKLPWVIIIIAGILNCFIPWSLFGLSETLISSSMASILNATTPIWTLMMGIFFFSTKSTFVQWMGIIIGFIGIIVMSGIDIRQLSIDNTYGFIAASLAPVFYGFSTQLINRFLKVLTNYQTSFYILLVTAISSGIAVGLTSSFNFNYFITDPSILISIIGLGCFGSGIAFIIYFYLVYKKGAEYASLVTYLVPASAILWGMTILSENINRSMIIGLLLILFGVYLSGRNKDKKLLPRKVKATKAR
ncbi:MAG: DMT family transporter [Vulcanibacillus sp.]